MSDRVKVLVLIALLGVAVFFGVRKYQETAEETAQADSPESKTKTWEDSDRKLPKQALPTPWPPKKGEAYPDIVLPTPDGEEVRLSDHKGKVIILEPIGMACPACQAWSGAHDVGPYGGGKPQKNLQSFEKLARVFGVNLGHERLLYVQLLLYDMTSRRAPTLEDGRKWREHFGLDRANTLVLVGDPRYVNRASHTMVPGFQLIGPDFRLRLDATKHNRDDLGALLQEARRLLR